MKKSQSTQRITITLPKEIYQKIKEQAERDTRTIGEQITHLLKLHVPNYTPQLSQSPYPRPPFNPYAKEITSTSTLSPKKVID